MTIEDIKQLIQGDETRTLEMKKTTGELKNGMHSACAFLNTEGGWLIFGITPTSLKISGQQVTDHTRQEIAHELTKIEPRIDIKVEYIDIPDKDGYQVIAIHFNEWHRGMPPYTYDYKPYYRVESTTKPMPRSLFEERLRDSKPKFYAWEDQTAEIGMDELDDEMIMNAGMSFFFKHLNLSGRIEGLKRTEELEIPYVALREALTNALCHRMYNEPRTSTGIAVYDNRVEIENPGVFPKGITPETIKMPHASQPYNPKIANVLFLSAYLEQWGSGVGRIVEACKTQDIDEPIYEEHGGFITIIFKRPGYSDKNVAQNVAQKKNDRQQQIIALIQQNAHITRAEMAESIGVSIKTIEREIEKMGTILKFVGSSKNGHWELALE